MTIQEFIERTGFAPTESYYHSVIEPEYMASSENDKDKWCKAWKRNGGIQKAYDAICKDAADSHLRLTTIEPLMKNLRDEKKELRDEIKILTSENSAPYTVSKTYVPADPTKNFEGWITSDTDKIENAQYNNVM